MVHPVEPPPPNYSDLEAPLPPRRSQASTKKHKSDAKQQATSTTRANRKGKKHKHKSSPVKGSTLDATVGAAMVLPLSSVPVNDPEAGTSLSPSSSPKEKVRSRSRASRKHTKFDDQRQATATTRADRKDKRKHKKSHGEVAHELAGRVDNSDTLSPGAVSVRGSNTTESQNTMQQIIAQPGERGHGNDAAAFIVSARLVREGNDDDNNSVQNSLPENFETKIQQVVESQLRKNHAVLATKVVTVSTSLPCGMGIRTFRIVAISLALILAAVVTGVVVAVSSNDNPVPVASPTPSPTVALSRQDILQEIKPWIIRTDKDEIPFNDSSSPQSRALDWLSEDPIALSPDRSTTTVLERYILAVVYYATNGPNWTRQDLNFLADGSVCDWNHELPQDHKAQGIFCDDTKSVRQVFLFDIGLAGALPWELSLLSNLQILSIGKNSLTGSIPTWLGDLTSLTLLIYADNPSTGTIPTEMGRLSALKSLQMHVSSLTGSLPRELGQLTALTWLGLSENYIAGTLPTELGLITTLENFYVTKNQLRGTIPTQFGHWTNLEVFSVYSNELTGTLPTELALTTPLEALLFYGNKLTGTLPTEWGRLTGLLEFQGNSNMLNGVLPSQYGGMTKLWKIILDNNLLTGSIPTAFGKLSALERFNVSTNRLTGTLPKELGQWTELLECWLNDNYFTGTLPTELGSLSLLQSFHVEKNGFNGTLPMELSQWRNLNDFFFHGNNFTGTANVALCSDHMPSGTLQGDCLATSDNIIEIECQCCTICCNANGGNCQETG